MSNIKGGAFLRINTNYSRLFPTEKRIADFMLENSKQMETISIGEIAQFTNSSKATVTRFCKRLGYDGFKDFRVSAIKDNQLGLNDFRNLVLDRTRYEKRTIDYICNSNAQACADTKLLLNAEVLQQAAAILLSKKRIFIVGDGIAATIALDFYFKLLRLGIIATYSLDRRTQLLCISLTTENDVVIGFDSSGNTKSTVELIKTAKNNGAETITICNTIGSPLAKASGMNIYGPAKIGTDISGTLAPRIALLCIVDCLFYTIEQSLGDSYLDCINRTSKAILDDWVQ